MSVSSHLHKIWAFILSTSLCKPSMSGFHVMQSWILDMCGVLFSSRDSKKNMIPIFNSEQLVWLKAHSLHADLQASASLGTPVWPAQTAATLHCCASSLLLSVEQNLQIFINFMMFQTVGRAYRTVSVAL